MLLVEETNLKNIQLKITWNNRILQPLVVNLINLVEDMKKKVKSIFEH